MAENQENEMYNFNLSFQSTWGPDIELVRRGRKKDPLNRELRIISHDIYQRVMRREIQAPRSYDFVHDNDDFILNGISSGKSNIYIFHCICQLEMDETRACK